MKKHTQRAAVVNLFLCLSAALAVYAGAPQDTRVPVPPIKTALGPMPGVAELTAHAGLPDVMTMADGTRVTTRAQWTARRAEMKRILSYYATGLMPPAPGNVSGRVLRESLLQNGAVRYRLVHLAFGPGAKYGFDIAVFTPATGGRFPTVVFPSFAPTPGGTPLPAMARPPEQGKGLDAMTVPVGDQSGRQPATPAAAPVAAPNADPESFATSYAAVFTRGYAIATYHYQDTGEDTIGRLADGSWAYRSTRYYPAYPNYDWSLAAGWAWGISRAIDYLERQPYAAPGTFLAIGHSRLGKAVLIAGAFDERIAVSAPAGSGAGGTGAYRFNGFGRGGREGLADMMRKYPNWFSPHLYQFAGEVDRLPFDQHWFMALTAPRGFIALDGADDQNCVSNALKQAWLGAMPAYTLFGKPGRFGVNFANHRHALTQDDWTALIDFADQQLLGKAVARRFDTFPEDTTVPATPPARVKKP